MIIGVDFDNTIVSYDALFHRVALEQKLIPESTPISKSLVRDHLRKIGKEDVWTEMQGTVYGPRMREAQPFPGVLEFFTRCRAIGQPVYIISHRSRYPYLGEQHDLHAAARDWLDVYAFHDAARIGLPRTSAFFELSKAEKIARIGQTKVTHFIDDLPELLDDATFPAAVEKILFDPTDVHAKTSLPRATSWPAIERLLLPPG